MIGRLRGVVAELNPDGSCIVDVGGVGYECFVPLGTLGRLPAPPEPATLHVHTLAREDALLLYAFATPEDRQAFRTLLGVSSVGPKLALAVLSSLDARQLAAAVATGDAARLKGIPGVGKRTAERLLLELKDRIVFSGAVAPAPTGPPGAPATPPAPDGPLAQVSAALVSMGFRPVEADRAVAAIAEDADGKDLETLLRDALAQLS